jgi:hypothetical protein
MTEYPDDELRFELREQHTLRSGSEVGVFLIEQ